MNKIYVLISMHRNTDNILFCYLLEKIYIVMEYQNANAVIRRLELFKMITSLTPQFDILINEQDLHTY